MADVDDILNEYAPVAAKPAAAAHPLDVDSILDTYAPKPAPMPSPMMRPSAREIAERQLATPDDEVKPSSKTPGPALSGPPKMDTSPTINQTVSNFHNAVTGVGTPLSVLTHPADVYGRAAKTGYEIGKDLPTKGGLEAFGTGTVSGGTFGLDDEAAGALGYIKAHRRGEEGDPFAKTPEQRAAVPAGPEPSLKDYVGPRDERRAVKDTAAKEHLPAYGAGETFGTIATAPIGGEFVAGAKTAVGAGLRAAAVAGSQGAISAAGHSEADLTKGDAEEKRAFAKDVLLGGGTAAAAALPLGAIGKVVAPTALEAGAVKRTETRTLDEATKGVAKSITDPIGENKALALKVLKDEKIPTADPAAQKSASLSAARKAQGEIDATLDNQNHKTEEVLKKLRALRDSSKAEANVRKYQAAIDSIEARFGSPKPLDDVGLLQTLTEQAKTGTKEKIGAKSADVLEVVKRHGLDKTAKDPIASEQAITSTREKVGQEIGKEWKSMPKDPKLLRGVMDKVAKLESEYVGRPLMKDHLAEVRRFGKDLLGEWGMLDEGAIQTIDNEGVGALLKTRPIVADKPVLPGAIRTSVSDAQKRGFQGGSFLDPTLSQDLRRKMAGSIDSALDDYLTSVGKKDTIDALNRDYSILSDLQIPAQKRMAAFPTKPVPPPTHAGKGVMTAREIVDLAEEMKPSPPSIISQREAIKVKPSTKPSEVMAQSLRDIVKSPELDAAAKKKEIAELFAQAAVERERKAAFSPRDLASQERKAQGFLKKARLDLQDKAISKTAETADRWIVKLADAAKKGNATAQMVDQAVKAGVPLTVARGIAAAGVAIMGKKKTPVIPPDDSGLDWGDTSDEPLEWEAPSSEVQSRL